MAPWYRVIISLSFQADSKEEVEKIADGLLREAVKISPPVTVYDYRIDPPSEVLSRPPRDS